MPRFIAKSPEDMPKMAEIAGLSGMEFFERMMAGEISGPPIGGLMGFEPVRVEKGEVEFRGTPQFEVTNPLGTVHGGWYGTILDSCMACSVQTMLEAGQTYTTLEYKVNIVRALPVGTEVAAVGTAQHIGRSTGVARGELRGVADGKLYATGSTTCIVMSLPKP